MKFATLLNAIAQTDTTFRREGDDWNGKCLICGGPIRFDAATDEGATVEHIRPRSPGGGSDPLNLGVAHGRCNGEKGRRWDSRWRHQSKQDAYEMLINRLLAERARRWRDHSASASGYVMEDMEWP